MSIWKSILRYYRPFHITRHLSQEISQHDKINFHTVFSFPSIKYIALINRLKVYHLAGTSFAIPTSGALELANVLPGDIIFTTSYIGLTAAAVLCLATFPLRNVIGFLYVSEDNKHIKISSVDFWGKRNDRIVPVQDWVPIMDLPSKHTDVIFLSPMLTDGTKYRLPIRYGIINDNDKFANILE